MDVGKHIYGLTILHYCGGGGYGEVYHCQDASGKDLALKIVNKSKIGSGWKRELKGITHYRQFAENVPGMLKLYHVGEDEDSFYYTMELADRVPDSLEYKADTLAARLGHGALPAEQLLPTLSAILEEIRTLHEAGFTHCDIKPENILFVKGEPKLADLGLLSPLTGTVTQLAGTLDYLPPEERTGETPSDTRESRQRNDLYAFGKLIYCCVTGNGASEYPSTSAEMPLNLANKLLFRLSLRLCDKEPIRRLASITELVCEFRRIELTCQKGETYRDHIRYFLATAKRNFVYALKKGVQTVYRHWFLVLLCLGVVGSLIWYATPSPPFDITKVKSKVYSQKSLGIEMDIPVEWEILSKETAQKWIAEIAVDHKQMSEQDKERLAFLKVLLEQGCDYIICGYDKTFIDNVTVQTVAVPGKMLLETSDDELRVGMQELFKGQLGFDTKIYDFRRMTLAGHKCIFVDLSHTPETRVHNYLFALEDKCFSITLTARRETFHQRLTAFNSVLSTLRFVK